jgi:hypothetical protein
MVREWQAPKWKAICFGMEVLKGWKRVGDGKEPRETGITASSAGKDMKWSSAWVVSLSPLWVEGKCLHGYWLRRSGLIASLSPM